MQLAQPVLRLPQASAGGAQGGFPPSPSVFFNYKALRLILKPIIG